jgi:hypothetical protein
MSVTTLVVGLGGTGVLTLRALKSLYQALPNDERVPAKFLAFDFDRSALLGSNNGHLADLKEDSEFYYLDPQAIQQALRNIDRAHEGQPEWEQILEWFPDRERVRIPVGEVEANGAGQMRSLGRLGFFLNDAAIERKIRQDLQELRSEIDVVRYSEDRRVILIASLAGGTGAGMLVDMAYLVRRQFGRPRVFAYLLLPEVFEDVDTGGRIFQNAYACIKEFSYLKDQQIPFSANYFHIPPIDVAVGGEEPFSRIFLFPSDSFSGPAAIPRACTNVARSVVGQLQRAIQHKTLAVVANTVSGDSELEQRRRRTHCFSTASSEFVPLKRVEPITPVVFEMVLRATRDDDFLKQIYGAELGDPMRELHEHLEALSQASSGQATPAATEPLIPPTSPQRESDEEVYDEQTEGLIRSWRGRVERKAAASVDLLLTELGQRVERLESDILRLDPTALEQARKELARLKPVVLYRSGSGHANLDEGLNELSSFTNHVEDLKDEVRSLLRSAERAQNLEQYPLRRKAFYERLLSLEKLFAYPLFDQESEAVTTATSEWDARAASEVKVAKTPWWRRVVPSFVATAPYARRECAALRQGLANKDLRLRLGSLLRFKAMAALKAVIQQKLDEVKQELGHQFEPWAGLPKDDVTRKFEKLEPVLQDQARAMLRFELPKLLEEAREIGREKDPERLRSGLFELVTQRVMANPWLRGEHYLIEDGQEKTEETLRMTLVRCRQCVFERRTPNPQHKGFALIMLPEGILWPRGKREDLRSFLSATTTQILGCQTQIVDYQGSRIWIYYEDLFNPPDHIRNIDEYHRRYQAQKFRELFHIDRRFLDRVEFKDVNSSNTISTTSCGNDPCRFNLSSVPRSERFCPGCEKPIRSRCGNQDCRLDDLHRRDGRLKKSCPECGEFNHGSWWKCCRHGETEVAVPIDKERCPRCLEAHHEDPQAFPRSRISLRPDLRDRLVCPSCEDLRAKDPNARVFTLPRELARFYHHGVNGHDSVEFRALAARHKLPQDHRCPVCDAHLIPVDHAVHTCRGVP